MLYEVITIGIDMADDVGEGDDTVEGAVAVEGADILDLFFEMLDTGEDIGLFIKRSDKGKIERTERTVLVDVPFFDIDEVGDHQYPVV